MRRTLWQLAAGAVLALGGGCASGPLLDNPLPVAAPFTAECEANPLYVPLGPASYGKVFEAVLEVLGSEGFDIIEINRYDGRIETAPRIAPGIDQPFKPGSPDLAQRWLMFLQSYRHRAQVVILPADNASGFFITVNVYKELEDLPRPSRMTAGAALFRNENNVARQFEVVDPTVFEHNWVPKGHDVPWEQSILACIKRRL
jgi:hypothetical protein